MPFYRIAAFVHDGLSHLSHVLTVSAVDLKSRPFHIDDHGLVRIP